MIRRAVFAAALIGASGSAAAQDGMTLGLVMPFSGWFAPIDADTIAGAKLAVDELNAAGGVLGQPITVVEFDTKSEPPLGADGAIQVIEEGADLIIVPSDFDFGAPGAFVAQSSGVVVFSGASDVKFGVQGIGDHAFSISNAAELQAAILAEWAYNEKGWRSAYVLTDATISFTKSLCAGFAESWRKLAGDAGLLGEDTFLNGDASIVSQTSRILALPSQPEIIFFCSYAPGGPSAMRQLRAAGINSAILTGESLDGDYWIGSVPDLSNFFVVNYGSMHGDDPSAEINAFYQRFEAKYGRRADVSYALRGYAMVEAYARAAESVGAIDNAAIVEALNGFAEQPLVIGPTSYSADLHIQLARPMTILEATEGKFAAVGRFAATDVTVPNL